MAEQQYGFNALHPRLAAQRERLARVAAAGALLEKASSNGGQSGSGGASADDMSVELSEADENGDNSSVEMGGMGTDGGKENPLLKPVKRRRMMKEDQYDKEDPFVDDTELAWEEQAAASKDGFFVYSGPLVPEGEKPQVERYVSILRHLVVYFSISANFNLPLSHRKSPSPTRTSPSILRIAPGTTPPHSTRKISH